MLHNAAFHNGAMAMQAKIGQWLIDAAYITLAETVLHMELPVARPEKPRRETHD